MRSPLRELLRAENLSITIGGMMMALDRVSLTAGEGECLGVFGMSGSGKTTLLRVLAGEEPPDSGSVQRESRLFAFAHVQTFLSGRLTPTEALMLWAALYGIPRGKRRPSVRDALTMVGLGDAHDLRITALSDGARKLLELARALLCPGDLLLLDEPSAGLDFESRRRVWEHLLRLRAHEGKCLVIATSRPDDAELCDRLALLHRGRVLASGTPAELRGVIGQEAMVITPLATKGTPNGSSWSGLVETEQDDSLHIEINPQTLPLELARSIPHDTAAVRITCRSLSSVLEDLAAEAEKEDAGV